MKQKLFNVAPLNTHDNGAHTEQMKRWRRLGAIDKANTIQVFTGRRTFRSVLEVGCGTGAVIAQLARGGFANNYCGIDLADPNSHRNESATELDLRQYDGKRIPFPDGAFYLVISIHVVDYVPDPGDQCAHLRRGTLRVERSGQSESITALCRHWSHQSVHSELFHLLLQTSGLEVEGFELFDHSIEVLSFPQSLLKGRLMKTVRSTALSQNPYLASRVFTYRCGAACHRATAAPQR